MHVAHGWHAKGHLKTPKQLKCTNPPKPLEIFKNLYLKPPFGGYCDLHPRRITTAFVGDRNTETHFTAEDPKIRQGRDTAMTGRVQVRWAP